MGLVGPNAVAANEVGDDVEAAGLRLEGHPAARLLGPRDGEAGDVGQPLRDLCPLRWVQGPVGGVQPDCQVEDFGVVGVGAASVGVEADRFQEMVLPVGEHPFLRTALGVAVLRGCVGHHHLAQDVLFGNGTGQSDGERQGGEVLRLQDVRDHRPFPVSAMCTSWFPGRAGRSGSRGSAARGGPGSRERHGRRWKDNGPDDPRFANRGSWGITRRAVRPAAFARTLSGTGAGLCERRSSHDPDASSAAVSAAAASTVPRACSEA